MRARDRAGFLAPTPHLSLLRVSKRYYYYYFGPGHFGWLFGLPQGFALPLKCPEFPACGLSANAAAAPPNDIVSANISAAINNEMRLRIRFLSFHPSAYTSNGFRIQIRLLRSLAIPPLSLPRSKRKTGCCPSCCCEGCSRLRYWLCLLLSSAHLTEASF